MDERSTPSSSRKRHRPDDLSASAYRRAQPPANPDPRNSRLSSVPAHPTDADLLIPSPGDTTHPAPVLEPLHPPIPNFTAISQGAPRPNPVSHPAAVDHPTALVYNIALPLPNPGRAHRFCQACDHVNHVRRKLCTNCGAPKPSAVRNAVGVRSITEVESATERRPQPDSAYRPEPFSQLAHQSSQYGVTDPHHRYTSQGLTDQDHKFHRTVDPSPYQARSLAMRCPGDDIPLLGSHQKGHPSPMSAEDCPTSRRIRAGQGILSEPLVNLNSIPTHDGKPISSAPRNPYGTVDLSQKVFPNHPMDGECIPLPSMQGVSNAKPMQSNLGSTFVPPRTSAHRGPLHLHDKQNDDPLQDDVLPMNRGAMGHMFDPRHVPQAQRRYQNVHGLRQFPKEPEQGNMYPGLPDLQTNTGLLYKQTVDIFQTPQHFRHDDREQFTRQEMPRGGDAFFPPLATASTDLERSFQAQQAEGVRVQHASDRTSDHLSLHAPVDRSRQSHMEPPTHSSHVNLNAHKGDDHLNQAALEESSRNPDDGRFAIESILMPHKGINGHGAP